MASGTLSVDREELEREGGTLTEGLVRLLRRRIEGGQLRPGARLPSLRALAERLGISRFTVVEAYERLAGQGLIESRHGAGFYVRSSLRPESPVRPALPLDNPDPLWLTRNILQSLKTELAPGSGELPPDWLAAPAASRTALDWARSYADPQGLPALRTVLARRLGTLGIGVSPAQVMTTLGVTQGLKLVLEAFTRPGDAVLADDPGWYLLFAQIGAHGLRLLPVPRHPEQGPDFARAETLIAEHAPRLWFTSALLNNPTSHSLTPPQGHALLSLAQRHGVQVVEDDIYGDLAEPGMGLRLAALAGLKGVLYLGGLAKSAAPGLRLGWVAADSEQIEALLTRKVLAGLGNPPVTEQLAAEWLDSAAPRRHLTQLRRRLHHARALAARAVAALGCHLPQIPEQGMYLWAEPPMDPDALTLALWREGILAAPGRLFSPTGTGSGHMRFNIAAASEPALMQRVARVLERARG